MAAEAPAAVVLGFDVGVSKAVVAYAPAGATSFGAELVRACAPRAHAARCCLTLLVSRCLTRPAL